MHHDVAELMGQRKSKSIAGDFLIHEEQRGKPLRSETDAVQQVRAEPGKNNNAAGTFDQIHYIFDRTARQHPILAKPLSYSFWRQSGFIKVDLRDRLQNLHFKRPGELCYMLPSNVDDSPDVGQRLCSKSSALPMVKRRKPDLPLCLIKKGARKF
jgi:hypothetical protein